MKTSATLRWYDELSFFVTKFLSGGGTVQFGSDDDCTNFVHLFFPNCSEHIPSCSKVQNDQVSIFITLESVYGIAEERLPMEAGNLGATKSDGTKKL